LLILFLLIYTIRISIFFSSFLYIFSTIFLLKLIIIIDKIYYNNATNSVIISRLLILVFVFSFSFFVNFSSKFIIRLFFLDLFSIIILYIKLIAILNINRFFIQFRYIYINRKYISIYKIKYKIIL